MTRIKNYVKFLQKKERKKIRAKKTPKRTFFKQYEQENSGLLTVNIGKKTRYTTIKVTSTIPLKFRISHGLI